MAKEIKIKNIGGPAPAAKPRAADLDPKQSVAPDPTGPVMTYEERRAVILAGITSEEMSDDEKNRYVDECLAQEHLPGPIPTGAPFCVLAHDASGVVVDATGYELGGALEHAAAITKCGELNAQAEAAHASFWFGVTHVPVEAK